MKKHLNKLGPILTVIGLSVTMWATIPTVLAEGGTSNPIPVINLVPTEVTLTVGDPAPNVMEGVTAKGLDDIPLVVNATPNSINTDVEGDYSVNYTAFDDKALTEGTATRVYHIVKPKSKAPILTVPAGYKIFTYQSFDPMVGVSAKSAEGVDLTSSITHKITSGDLKKEGTVIITYSVTSAEGVTTTQSRTMTVFVDQAPLLSVPEKVEVAHGGAIDLKANILSIDAEDGDLTSKINISGVVDTTKEGTYEIQYSITDKGGNKVSAKMVVTVLPPEVAPKPIDPNIKAPVTTTDAKGTVIANTTSDAIEKQKAKLATTTGKGKILPSTAPFSNFSLVLLAAGLSTLLLGLGITSKNKRKR